MMPTTPIIHSVLERRGCPFPRHVLTPFSPWDEAVAPSRKRRGFVLCAVVNTTPHNYMTPSYPYSQRLCNQEYAYTFHKLIKSYLYFEDDVVRTRQPKHQPKPQP